jgi:hypothetical protein
VRFHAQAAIGEDKRSAEGQQEDKRFFHGIYLCSERRTCSMGYPTQSVSPDGIIARRKDIDHLAQVRSSGALAFASRV